MSKQEELRKISDAVNRITAESLKRKIGDRLDYIKGALAAIPDEKIRLAVESLVVIAVESRPAREGVPWGAIATVVAALIGAAALLILNWKKRDTPNPGPVPHGIQADSQRKPPTPTTTPPATKP